jgi:DNA polymerase gamma 1
MIRALQPIHFKKVISRQISSTKLIENSQPDVQPSNDKLSSQHEKLARPSRTTERRNIFGIPLISEALDKILFGNENQKNNVNPDQLQKAIEQLRSFGIRPSNESANSTEAAAKLSFQLPMLYGNVESHFYRISQDYINPFVKLINGYVEKTFPTPPTKWEFRSGWTRYDPLDGSTSVVPCPLEDIFW